MLNLAWRRLTTTDDAEGPAYVLAYRLGGQSKVPRLLSAAPNDTPPTAHGPEAGPVLQGHVLYDTLWCAYCHGHDLDNSGHISIPTSGHCPRAPTPCGTPSCAGAL